MKIEQINSLIQECSQTNSDFMDIESKVKKEIANIRLGMGAHSVYHELLDKKAKTWQRNHIRQLDYGYQKKQFVALQGVL